MKKLCALAVILLGVACVGQAQTERPDSISESQNVSADFSRIAVNNPFSISAMSDSSAVHPLVFGDYSASSSTIVANAASPVAEVSSSSTFATPAPPAAAEPAPASPKPRFMFSDRDDYRWQLSMGVSLVRFRSSVYYATAVGLNTSVAYFTNEWFAVEGSVTAAFAPSISTCSCQDVRFAAYGVGPRISMRKPRWEPWLHGIVGGAHVVPQTSLSGKNSYEIQAGGGVDYRWKPRLSTRVEVDWVRTGLFGQTQNNAQAIAGLVLHF